MGTLIRVIFREGHSKKMRASPFRRSSVARERGLLLWHERDDLVIAAAFRAAPAVETGVGMQPAAPSPLRFAPQA